MTALHFIVTHANQVDRGPLARVNGISFTIVVLDSANANFDFARFDGQLVADTCRAARHATRDDGFRAH